MSNLIHRYQQVAGHFYEQFPGLPFTFLEVYIIWIAIILAALGIYFLVKFITDLRKSADVDYFFFWAECMNCGWKGEVSRFTKRCPSCSSLRLKPITPRGRKERKKRKKKKAKR